jgi:Lysophospholipase L1 and related esterases
MKTSQIFVLLMAVTLTAFAPVQKLTRVYLIGDSTMSEKLVSAYPETGWGMPFQYFFDSNVVVENHAKNGRSTKTFISENRWTPIAEKLQPGDWVFIQFGHNDESKEKQERYTRPEQYRQNLLGFVKETRARQANPVLLTPVARRRFQDGKILESHAEYSALVREVAKSEGVPLIDIDKASMELYQRMGEENSKLLFLHLEPGEHPNYPDGKVDNTHFTELGARLIAQLVLKEMVALKLGLAEHVVKPEPKR